jgi:hypothetical protein
MSRYVPPEKRTHLTVQTELGRRMRATSTEAKRADPVAWRAAVAETVFRARGIEPGVWACDWCSTVYVHEHYPSSDCKGCRRPLPRRCLTAGCGAVCAPVEVATPGLQTDRGYVPGAPDVAVADRCPHCTDRAGHQGRAEMYSRVIMPRHLSAVAVSGYFASAADLAIEAWLDRDLGRSIGACALYLWGPPGSGKSQSAARALWLALVNRGLVSTAMWVTEAQLYPLHLARYRHDSERDRQEAARAADTWKRAADVGLLVLDELFAHAPKPGFSESLADLVRERIDHRKPFVITSNLQPQWSAHLDGDRQGRIESRWTSLGVTVELSGVDWRTSRGAA